MGALPKQRTSKGRKARRRSQMHLALPQLDTCPNCKQKKVAHHVCTNCGVYNGRQVLTFKNTTTED